MPNTTPHPDRFVRRHIGPAPSEVAEMLRELGVGSLDELVAQTVPASIRLGRELTLPPAKGEQALLERARRIGARNRIFRSYIGMGYADCHTPPIIQRNILENPAWYTPYTPYQSEISQGRLEALLNFQTMVSDLTGLGVANASLLDEATAAAEAMRVAHASRTRDSATRFFVSDTCHPQTIDVVRTRARAAGIDVVVGDHRGLDLADGTVFGALVQYPATEGDLFDYRPFAERLHASGALIIVAADLLSLALLVPPGEFGADMAIGTTQRFGVPLGFGGPHAAYFACTPELIRKMPGRIIGVSRDAHGRAALRMALGTREQHIRRERATSNICTSQALLATLAAMYAIYHGPDGLRAIAERVHRAASLVATGLSGLGIRVENDSWFDTLRVCGAPDLVAGWLAAAEHELINLRRIDETSLGISVDETTGAHEIRALLRVFTTVGAVPSKIRMLKLDDAERIPPSLRRKTPILAHPIFNTHHSETQLLRYIRGLEERDLSLTQSMIPLGSCTMKLNPTAAMIPLTDRRWSRLHPFVPASQSRGYRQVFDELESALVEITGMSGVSLQPNAGSQGEFAGLLVIRELHRSRGHSQRNICLIPASAHGTNPASAVMAGFEVVVVRCDDAGNVDVGDLEQKAREHREKLGALMITYPSTHGVFEQDIVRICALVHEHGGQVYMDGANMNAQVGLCRPGDMGADVCHLNLHKTFAIPHGGGGPGVGPIAVAEHLVPFLPRHSVVRLTGGSEASVGAVSAAPWGSASILLISWAYIQMMGAEGLTRATKTAILNANYIAHRLASRFPVVYAGSRGRVAHECILDMRGFKKSAGIEVDDIAKRLMDYGFHAPTMSFPIPGTLMIEPTESESKGELDRFCEAMIAIREEIRSIENGLFHRADNPLKNAPHTAFEVTASEWAHPYSREQAAYPARWTRDRKFWPPVSRLDNAFGDRKLVCACLPVAPSRAL